MISIQNLSKTYIKEHREVQALKNVSIDIGRGTIHGIIGLSGAGKSSLVRCINRLETPTAGTVFVAGDNMMALKGTALKRKRQKIGMIFQNFNLLSSKTVFDNVAFPLEIIHKSKQEIRSRVVELLALTGLSDKADAYPAQLSGGQKQRVGIARALANAPDVLLCDEATSALDPLTTAQILDLVREINENLGVTVVVITHEMDVIKRICHKVTLLEGGEVVASGDTVKLFTQPENEAARQFFSSDNVPPYYAEDSTVCHLIFKRGNVDQPVLSKLIRTHDVTVNILSGKIETYGRQTVGELTVALTGSDAAIADTLKALEAHQVITEVCHV